MSIDDGRPPEELPELNPYRSPQTIGATGPPSVLRNVLRIALGAFCILFGVTWALLILWMTVKEGPSIRVVMGACKPYGAMAGDGLSWQLLGDVFFGW